MVDFHRGPDDLRLWSLEFGLESGYCVPGLLHRAALHYEKVSFTNFPSFVILLIEREDIITFRQYLDKTVSQSLHEIKSLLLSSRPHPLSFLTLPSLHSHTHTHTRSGPEKTETRHQQNSPFAHSTPNPSTSKPVSQS